ncbi:4'-phosphopantetheinyl transferase family protein [Pseudodesulfovibrio methanolicus]|uniref:4'-phosphopantetheinyl transferase superfamily protein n=1 Tax=Pseudodesulfovibrio methanolicus TaxID=3126690 RepID=A0ABZ2IX76_9BACT
MILFCNGMRIAVHQASVGTDRHALIEASCHDLTFDAQGFSLVRGKLGAPKLIGKTPPPAISFTTSGETLWCAVSLSRGLGIDVACPEEFMQPYPVPRVFDPTEIKLTETFVHDPLSRLALLWSLKEAVAKALGTGFNTVDPGELTATALYEKDDKLSGTIATPKGELPIVAVPVNNCWLALAQQ